MHCGCGLDAAATCIGTEGGRCHPEAEQGLDASKSRSAVQCAVFAVCAVCSVCSVFISVCAVCLGYEVCAMQCFQCVQCAQWVYGM